MKKLFITLAFLGLMSAPVSAQDTEIPQKKHSVATNSSRVQPGLSAQALQVMHSTPRRRTTALRVTPSATSVVPLASP